MVWVFVFFFCAYILLHSGVDVVTPAEHRPDNSSESLKGGGNPRSLDRAVD